jgi:hypothetical protein
MPKAQAAMEFLMTYGWAILVLLAITGAFAYFGVLSPKDSLPDQCIVGTGFSCSNYKLLQDAGKLRVQLRVENRLGQAILVQKVNVSTLLGTTTHQSDCSIPADTLIDVDKYLPLDCTLSTMPISANEKASTNVKITYVILGGAFNRTTEGSLKGTVDGCPPGGCPAAAATCMLITGQFCAASAPANSAAGAGGCGSGNCYKCNAGMVYDGITCSVPTGPSCASVSNQFCSGSALANSQPGTGYCASGSCYMCNTGYMFNAGSCQAVGVGSFTGNYYNGQNFNTLVLTRNDPAINFNWAGGSPAAGVTVEDFSVRWVGNFVFSGGSHTFTMRSDDGIRLYIDDVLVQDSWYPRGSTTDVRVVTMTAGTHNIRFEYFEVVGLAEASLTWT